MTRYAAALIGCLLGGAVGDALGLPAERLSRSRQRRLFPTFDGYRFVPSLSTDDEFTFARPQPPPVAQTRAKAATS